MNAEQLKSARLARWSQNGEARLTMEAAAEWLAEVGFCPYLPAGPAGGPPAPSFLEAVVGRPAESPSAGERARAMELLARLIENSSAIPLKFGSSLGEQPDFVSSPDVLRFVYALRGDRNFKTGPLTVGNEKVTQLSQHCWQAMEQQGSMDVAALQPILGRDITEAAISRALQELWGGMYIFPVLSATGQPAQWDLLFRRFPKQVAEGACTGHAEALSAMLSLYLQATVAALDEEVLTFLSPLAPQSKLREVIRGLGSMRQLDILDIGGRSHIALEGGLLPEMVAQLSESLLAASAADSPIESEGEAENGESIVTESEIEIEAVPQSPARPGQSHPLEDSDKPAQFAAKKSAVRKFIPRHSESARPASGKFAARSAGDRGSVRSSDRGASRSGAGGFSRPAGSNVRRPKSFSASGEDRPRGDRPRRMGPGSFGRDRDGGVSRGSFSGGPSSGGSSSRGPASRRPDSRGPGERGSNTPERKGYAAKGHGAGERAKRWQKSGEVPEAPSSGGRPFGAKPTGFKSTGFKSPGFKRSASKFSGAKPWQSKPRPSSRPTNGGESEERPKPWKKFDAAGDGKPGSRTGPTRAGAGRPYASKPYAKSAGWKATGSKPHAARPWAAKSSSDTESFPRGPSGTRGSKGTSPRSTGERPKPWQRSGLGAGDRPTERKPWASKGAAARVGSAKSYADRSSAKPYAKAGGTKPWAKRSAAASAGEGGRPPKRRFESSESSGAPSGEKAGAKPFWAKNPRGGKGSVAASRTNRPRGSKAGKKSGKKK